MTYSYKEKKNRRLIIFWSLVRAQVGALLKKAVFDIKNGLFFVSKRAGAAPIKTKQGWLEIYHGANADNQYCLGAFLMDLNDPSKVISRTTEAIMVPTEVYELSGFFGYVVFTNGHVVNGDEVTIYYGAADEFVCGAKFSIDVILKNMK